jgi:hypothetical protein
VPADAKRDRRRVHVVIGSDLAFGVIPTLERCDGRAARDERPSAVHHAGGTRTSEIGDPRRSAAGWPLLACR